MAPKVLGEPLGDGQDGGEQKALRGALGVKPADRREHVLLHLRAEAPEGADPLLLSGGAELLEARDAELVVEAPRGPRADSRD
jgi:hypothetical protein